MRQDKLLGAYLRACRERVSPADVGLAGLGPRRVAGLRREEVALLAGISANYYLRLEQGRDRHPSAQVLEALARALRLDATETAQLLALGQPRAKDMAGARLVTVPASISQLLRTPEPARLGARRALRRRRVQCHSPRAVAGAASWPEPPAVGIPRPGRAARCSPTGR